MNPKKTSERLTCLPPNPQILHYEFTQKFSEHHDYFDPDEDPPENFEPGGNRLATALLYLENAGEVRACL